MQENVINKIYIDGEFVTPHGTELVDLFNPATGKVIGQVQLADEVDTEAAVAAAKRALPAWSATSREERIDALRRLQAAVAARRNEILEAVTRGVRRAGAQLVHGRFDRHCVRRHDHDVGGLRLHPAHRQRDRGDGAGRRRRPDHAVELRSVLHLPTSSRPRWRPAAPSSSSRAR